MVPFCKLFINLFRWRFPQWALVAKHQTTHRGIPVAIIIAANYSASTLTAALTAWMKLYREINNEDWKP